MGAFGAAAEPVDRAERPDQRLSRRQRLTESRRIEEAFERGPAFPGRFLVLRLRAGTGAAGRLAVIVSKRVLRRAVDRNRAKRLLREAYRLNRHRLTAACDVVLLARAPIARAARPEVDVDLLHQARRAGILKDL